MCQTHGMPILTLQNSVASLGCILGVCGGFTEVGNWDLLKGTPAVSSCLSLVPCPVLFEQLSSTAHSCCDNAPLTCMDEAASN